MPLTIRICLPILFSCIALIIYAQNDEKQVTADQIIQRAIDSLGGEKSFDLNNTSESISQIITPQGDSLSFAEKRMNFDKYYISILSLSHENTTKIFNNGKAVFISNQNARQITDPLELEELHLKSFICREYGYKKLAYRFEREDDQKFRNFDCFVVLVTSPLGNSALNYYDKETGKPLMIIYPNLRKSIFTNFFKTKSITSPSGILMVDTLDAITSSALNKLSIENNLDSNWFNIPITGIYKTPETFKTGEFKYLNSDDGAKIIRESTRQTEISGNSKTEYKIEWTSDSDYLLYKLRNAFQPPTNENIEFIKVRITSWTGNKYYCQYITNSNIGGTCVFEKIK